MWGAVASVRMEPHIQDDITAVRKKEDNFLLLLLYILAYCHFPHIVDLIEDCQARRFIVPQGITDVTSQNQITLFKCMKYDAFKFIFYDSKRKYVTSYNYCICMKYWDYVS
jgi:hypothetical protein